MAKSLALSFDDGLDPKTNPQAEQINDDILKTLKQNKITAIVYPSISKIGGEPGRDIIAKWGQEGQHIGNHSNLHMNFNKPDVTLANYLKDVQEGHDFFKNLKGFVPRYRFPFLKEGNTEEKRDGMRKWLKVHNYRSGAVSIDASDWYYNQLYLKYQENHDTQSLGKLKKAYITHLLGRADYYDNLALKTIERSPNHVILLHVRAINAAWLPDIIQAFKQQKWQFIDSEKAYTDPIYQLHLQVLPAGESILWSIAKVYGVQGLRYPAEDAPYEADNLKKFGLTP